MSRAPVVLSTDLVVLLGCFGEGAPPDEVVATLRARWDSTEEEVWRAVRNLVALGVLIPEGDERARIGGGFADLAEHLAMLRDDVRTGSYARALAAHVRGKRVLDLGCGTGLMSLLALRAGAKEVIAVEESDIADVAAEMFARNGVAQRVRLERTSSFDLTLARRADVIVHELFGADPLAENAIAILRDAHGRLLEKGGRMIPSSFEVRVAGAHVERTSRHALRDLARRHGLALGAITRRLDVTPERVRHGLARERLLTTEAVVVSVRATPTELRARTRDEVTLTVRRAGTLSTLATWFRACLAPGIELTNHPAGTPTHWGWSGTSVGPRRLARGDRVALHVEADPSGVLRTSVAGIERLR